MPNRLLREGITTSDHIDKLSPEAEVCFYRLLVVCDDFGCFDARVAIIKAQCFPLRKSATEEKIERWLSELAESGLIQRYRNADKVLLSINRWEQRQRSRPKFAQPTDDGSTPIVGSLSDNCRTDVGLGRGRGKGKGRGATSRHGRELLPLPDDWMPSESVVERLSREFGLRVPEDVDRYVAAFRDACKSKGYEYKNFDAAFANSVRQDWPKFRANGAVGKVRSIV